MAIQSHCRLRISIADCRLDWRLSIGLPIVDWIGHCGVNPIANRQSLLKSSIANRQSAIDGCRNHLSLIKDAVPEMAGYFRRSDSMATLIA
jgi:hypothetical protein